MNLKLENSKAVQVLCMLVIYRLNSWNLKSEAILVNLALFNDVVFLDLKR